MIILFLLFAALCCCIVVCALRSIMLFTWNLAMVSAPRFAPEPVKNARSPPERYSPALVVIAAKLMPRSPVSVSVRNRDGGLGLRRKLRASMALSFRPARENARNRRSSTVDPFHKEETPFVCRICYQFVLSEQSR